MKYLYYLLWSCMVSFLSCNEVLSGAEDADEEIEIFPDYKEVAVPCNIAPLNFKLKVPCEATAKSRRRSGAGCWTHRQEEPLRSESISVKTAGGFDILLFPSG